jgi:hypothetical protein
MPILAPTFIDEHEVPFSTSSSPGGSANTGSFSVTAGDLLVILGSSEDSQRTLGTPTGGGLTYTLAQSVVVTNNCTVYAWTAVCTSTTSITVTITVAGGSGAKLWGFNVLRFRGGAVGASSKTNNTGAPTLNITTTRDNSAVAVINSDWAAVDGTSRTWRTNAGTFTEQHYYRNAASYTTYGGYHASAGTTGTYAVGLSAPGGQTYAIIAVEVKGTIFDLGSPATETDTAQAITPMATVTVAIGRASETDIAQVIAPPSGTTVSIGQASETDTGQSITVISPITVAVGRASETDTAQTLTVAATATVAVGQASETDTAQGVTPVAVISRTVATAMESDTAQSVTVQAVSTVSVGQSTETDTAGAVSPSVGSVPVAVGTATESDTAQSLTVQSTATVAVATATETDTAQDIAAVPSNTLTMGRATETDTAQAVTPVAGTTTVAVGQAGETDTAQQITAVGMGSALIDTAEETDTAQSITVLSVITVAVGQAGETDSAQSVSVVLAPLVLGVGIAGETDTAQAITSAGSGVSAAIGTATETDTAGIISPQAMSTVPLGIAQEGDTAQPFQVSSTVTIPIDFASELDAGDVIAVFLSALGIPVNGAVESSSAFAFTALAGNTTIPVDMAGETDTAQGITTSFVQNVDIARAIELDTAGEISVRMASGRNGFLSGPCADWEPLWCGTLSTAAMAATGEAVTMATDVLWHLSGQRFGVCEVIIRPCRAQCAEGYGTLDDWWAGIGAVSYLGSGGPRPWWADGVWYNVCGGCTSGCSCTELSEAILPAPTRDVVEVRLDGIVLNPSTYRVDENRRLVRTDGGVWPMCQRMDLSDDQPGTWSVTLTVGESVPTLARRALGDLAAEFAKDCAGENCVVPYDVTSLTRQGITLDFGNPNAEHVDSMVRLLGLRMVRLFLATYNPMKLQQRGKVYDVSAMPRPWKRVNTS